MDLESIEGTVIAVERGSKSEIGRGLGLRLGPCSSDRTVSRRHVSLYLLGHEESNDPGGMRVLFEVIGKNPIWVCSRNDREKRVYRRLEKGELRAGDRFTLSLRNPYFLVIKRREGGKEGVDKKVLDAVERREKRTLERREEEEERAKAEVSGCEGDEEAVIGGLGLDLRSLDVTQIDPVKEFGFLVKGHEFDQYPRQKILAVKNWNWFLEEPGDNREDDEAASPEGKSRGRKKRGGDNEDEDWTGESEDEKVLVAKGGSIKRSKYSTRSKNPKKPCNDALGSRKSALRKDIKDHKEEVGEEDEEDETLGGFIVNDDEEDETLGGFIVNDDEEEELKDEEDEEESEEEEEEVW